MPTVLLYFLFYDPNCLWRISMVILIHIKKGITSESLSQFPKPYTETDWYFQKYKFLLSAQGLKNDPFFKHMQSKSPKSANTTKTKKKFQFGVQKDAESYASSKFVYIGPKNVLNCHYKQKLKNMCNHF